MNAEALKLLTEIRDALRVIAVNLHVLTRNDTAWKKATLEEQKQAEAAGYDYE